MKRIALLLTFLLLSLALAACAPGGQASASAPSAPEPPQSFAAPGPDSPQPEEPPQTSSSSSEPALPPESSQPEPSSSQPPQNDDVTPLPYEESEGIDRDRAALRAYLMETLTEEGYTNFYITEDQLGLGVDSPDIQAVQEAVAAYGGTPVEVEYRQVLYSRARLDAAKEAYERMEQSLGERIICNISWSGIRDGLIHITIHQMHPALREFLDTSGYGECFSVEVTGADSPIVNPDT